MIFGEPGVDEDTHVSVETVTDDLTIRDAAVSGEDAVRMLMAIATT